MQQRNETERGHEKEQLQVVNRYGGREKRDNDQNIISRVRGREGHRGRDKKTDSPLRGNGRQHGLREKHVHLVQTPQVSKPTSKSDDGWVVDNKRG